MGLRLVFSSLPPNYEVVGLVENQKGIVAEYQIIAEGLLIGKGELPVWRNTEESCLQEGLSNHQDEGAAFIPAFFSQLTTDNETRTMDNGQLMILPT
jgi:hypothetical protein